MTTKKGKGKPKKIKNGNAPPPAGEIHDSHNPIEEQGTRHSPTDQCECNPKEPIRWKDEPPSNRIMVYVTIALTLFTGVLACFTLGLFNKTADLVGDSKKQTDIFSNQFELADSSNRMQNRAYINVDFNEVKIKNFPDSTIIRAPFINSGKTPGYNVHVHFMYHLTDTNIFDIDHILEGTMIAQDGALTFLKDSVHVNKVIIGIGVTNQVIGIGRSETISGFFNGNFGDYRFSKKDAEAIYAGTKRLYFYERMTYNDIFGRPHFTNFCLFTKQSTQVWEMYYKYNDSD